MSSSTSSSEPSATGLTPLVLVITLVLLCAYGLLVTAAGWRATFAESNMNAGLLRLQALESSRGSSAISVGTSITAKLLPDLIFEPLNTQDNLNMGIDGGSALFAAQEILASESQPELVLIETNFILKRPGSNSQTLQDTADSFAFQMARHVPVLRREYRPVTLLYAALKLYRDERRSSGSSAIRVDASQVPVERPEGRSEVPPEQQDMMSQWTQVLTEFERDGVQVVLVMVPDGKNDREVEYQFSRQLAARQSLPFIDLKAYFDGRGLVYSDGTHLVRRSAETVSTALKDTLVHYGLTGQQTR